MRDPARPRGIIALAAALPAVLLAARPALPAQSSEPRATRSPIQHSVPRASSPITVDGVLDEPAWAGALRMEIKYEVQPGENIEPPVRTTCLAVSDDRNVYFAFRAFDPDPSQIRARLSDRDKAWSDDWVGVVLDTFNDQRRAYELFSNPLGVQIDALNDDVNHVYDESWNAIWRSAGRITEQGYEVEMAIPFNQIRFQSVNGNEQVWGFDALRSYPRGDRHHIGLFPRERGNDSYLSQADKLVGMAGATPGKNLEIMPTLTASRSDVQEPLPDGNLERGDPESDLGLTVRWGITPNTSLNGALNPDFSQVEADALRLDINEQFALFYPETRPFFLEGADYFSTPFNLLHTRTVADPDSALKVTGKGGRHTYGVFTSRDAITNMIFPGAEGSSSDSFDTEATTSVGRYRYDVAGSSTVGAMFTDRRGDGYSNQVASADATIRFTEADRLTLNFAGSRTQYSDAMVRADGVPADPFDGWGGMFDYLHSVRNWWAGASHTNLDEGFRADAGFIPQVGYRSSQVSGARIWWGEKGDFYRRLGWGGRASRMERQDGALIDEGLETWVNMNGPRQSFLGVSLSLRNQGYDGAEFDGQYWLHTWFEIQATPDLNLVFHDDYGDWIDYTHTRHAYRTLVEYRLRQNLGRRFKIEYAHIYTTLEVEGGHLYRVHAPELRLVEQFNARSYVRAVVQYADIQRNTSLYADPVDRRSKDLFVQLLFTYKVNPQTALYVGCTDNHYGTQDYDVVPAERAYFVKLGYAWVQ